jgi:phospholipase C
VFIVKENRSFDHMFGLFPGANGVTVGDDHGAPRPLSAGLVQTTGIDLPHHYSDALKDVDGGKMDGFRGSAAFTQYHPDQIPNYWKMASDFVLGDKFFAPVNGPSFPNHLFSIAASSAGTKDIPSNVSNRGKMVKSWGCDANSAAHIGVYDEMGNVTQEYPCFDTLTLGDQLTSRGISWRYYAATTFQRGYIWSAYDAIRHIRNGDEWRKAFPSRPRVGYPGREPSVRDVGDAASGGLRAP